MTLGPDCDSHGTYPNSPIVEGVSQDVILAYCVVSSDCTYCSQGVKNYHGWIILQIYFSHCRHPGLYFPESLWFVMIDNADSIEYFPSLGSNVIRYDRDSWFLNDIRETLTLFRNRTISFNTSWEPETSVTFLSLKVDLLSFPVSVMIVSLMCCFLPSILSSIIPQHYSPPI